MTVTSPAPPYPTAIEAFPRLRQSLLSDFDRCGLKAKLDMIAREDGWSSHDQARGQVFHRVAAKCLNVMSAQDEDFVPVSVALAILEECLRQHDVDDECPSCLTPGLVEVGGRYVCQECGRDFATRSTPLPVEQIIDLRMSTAKWANEYRPVIRDLADVEKRLRVPITYDGGAYGPVERIVSGQLDALFFEPNGHAIVLDWKDTWGLPAPTEVSFSGYFQQRFYAYLVLKSYPAVTSVTLREFYVRYSVSREVTVGRADLPNIEAELSALVERFDRAYDHQAWRPAPGKHCAWCPLPERCTIFKDARGEGSIENDEDARRVAAEVLVAEAVREKRVKALKAWSTRKGNVLIPVADAKGRTHFGYQSSEKVEKPTREAMEAEIRKAKADGREPDFDKLYRKKRGTRFGAHSPTGPGPSPEDARIAEQLRASVDALREREGRE